MAGEFTLTRVERPGFRQGVVAGGRARASLLAIDALPQDIPDDTNVTLAFENLSGQSATVDAVFEVREEW